MDKAKTLTRLSRTMTQTLAAFEWDGKTLKRSYGEGKWTGREILGHLTDCELVFLYRLQFMLAEDTPPVFPFEQDLWAKRFGYARRDGERTKSRYRALREAMIDLTRGCTDSDFARRAKRPDNPNYTVGYLIEHAAEHNERHLEQLEAIRAGRGWAPPS